MQKAARAGDRIGAAAVGRLAGSSAVGKAFSEPPAEIAVASTRDVSADLNRVTTTVLLVASEELEERSARGIKDPLRYALHGQAQARLPVRHLNNNLIRYARIRRLFDRRRRSCNDIGRLSPAATAPPKDANGAPGRRCKPGMTLVY